MKKAFFLSDTHLGASYFPDSREREHRVVAFLDSIKEEASQIYLLGDILDYWYEYRYVVPRGFVRFFGKIAELSDSGIEIYWIIGNHDIWIFDYIPNELGVKVIDGTFVSDVLGTKMLMAHGDGIWQHDWKFKTLRGLFRNKTCQKLFAAIHPRWTVAFANAWSRQSRISETHDSEHSVEIQRRVNENVTKLMEFCREYSAKDPDCKYFLFGHLHKMIEININQNAEMIILGDWIDIFSYAVFDGKKIELRRWERE